MNNGQFDQRETRDPEQRELAQFNLLPDFIRKAIASAPGWAEHLNGVDPSVAISREGLAKLPILRKPFTQTDLEGAISQVTSARASQAG